MAWFWNDFFLSNSGDLVKNSQFIIGHIGDQAQIIGGNGNDELSNLIAIERVDSRDVVFDNRPKKTKILGKYVMGDVLGEWKILVHCNNWSNYPEMVFCFQNCYDPFWEKNILVIEKNFWNSRLNAENLQNFWNHLDNLFI